MPSLSLRQLAISNHRSMQEQVRLLIEREVRYAQAGASVLLKHLDHCRQAIGDGSSFSGLSGCQAERQICVVGLALTDHDQIPRSALRR